MIMSFFIILLFLLTISNSYKMYFYFYLDDSISSLTIDNNLIFSGNNGPYIETFQTLGPYDITLGPNKKMTLLLFNDDGPYALNGYIEIDGYRFYTDNPLLRCTNCTNKEKKCFFCSTTKTKITAPNCYKEDSNGISYGGYEGDSLDDIEYFEFIFEIPENELQLKQKSNQYEIQYNAKDFQYNQLYLFLYFLLDIQ